MEFVFFLKRQENNDETKFTYTLVSFPSILDFKM